MAAASSKSSSRPPAAWSGWQQDQPRLAHHPRAAAGAHTGRTYDLDAIASLPELLDAHAQHQRTALAAAAAAAAANSSQPPPAALLVVTSDGVGLGNRVPAIVTGYALALLSGSLFLVNSSLLEHMRLPLPAAWPEHAHLYARARTCSVSWRSLATHRPWACGGRLARYFSIDYEVPLLQLNGRLAPAFARFFPDGEVLDRKSVV